MSADNPWQLYSVNLNPAQRRAYNDARRELEKGWHKARKLVTVQAAGDYMAAILRKHEAVGATDTEGWMELARRLYVQFGIAAKTYERTARYFG